MSPFELESTDGSIEECVDDIDEFIATLERYPQPVLAFALRTHLGSLLRALLERELCSRDEVRVFLRDLEQEILQSPDGAGG